EDAARQPLWAELLELVERLPHAEELDGLARDLLDGQSGAAARIAIQLGQNHAVEIQSLVERLGGFNRRLPNHGVADQEDVGWLHLLVDLLELLHQGLVDGEPPSGIEDHRVATV